MLPWWGLDLGLNGWQAHGFVWIVLTRLRFYRNEVPKPEDPDGPPRWQADNVCKKYLVKFCPNDLFVNTKSDLGKCLKMHDDRLKQAYETYDKKDKDKFVYKYSLELLTELEQLQTGVDRAIRRFGERMAMAMPNMVCVCGAARSCTPYSS